MIMRNNIIFILISCILVKSQSSLFDTSVSNSGSSSSDNSNDSVITNNIKNTIISSKNLISFNSSKDSIQNKTLLEPIISNFTTNVTNGSSSGDLDNFNCHNETTVSVVGASFYCLPEPSNIKEMCGNDEIGTDGKCPIAGAIPWDNTTGHVLLENAICKEHNKIFKCFASEKDRIKQKKTGKRPNKSIIDGDLLEDDSQDNSINQLKVQQFGMLICFMMTFLFL